MKIKGFLLFVIIGYVTLCPTCFGKTKTVTSEYIYHIPENVSAETARETALTRARIQAIADEFGTLVSQTNSTMVDNTNGQSNIDFLSLGGSEVKGEWIEDIEPPVFEYITDGDNLAIRVRIKGKIRELEGNRLSFDAHILRNGTNDSDESDRFTSGDDLYISFNSPVGGYLAVYLVDTENNAFCLLPYQAQTNGIFETKANHRYLFFHPDHSHGIKATDVDRIIVDTEQQQERNKIILIFSPNRFYKGADSKINAECPRSMPYDQFTKWLSNIRKRDKDLTISERAILITSNQ